MNFDAVVRATGVKVVLIDVERRAGLEPAFETMKKSRIDGLLVQADDLFINEGTRIIELAAVYRLPTIYRSGQRAAELLLAEADVGALSKAVELALFYDAKLDVAAS